MVKLLGIVLETQWMNSDEAIALLKIITDYIYAFGVLDWCDPDVAI
jgi:hypothetical protein